VGLGPLVVFLAVVGGRGSCRRECRGLRLSCGDGGGRGGKDKRGACGGAIIGWGGAQLLCGERGASIIIASSSISV
jgi:hypothetical protein